MTLFFSFDENVTVVGVTRISNQNQRDAFEPGNSVIAAKALERVLLTRTSNQIRCERRSIVYILDGSRRPRSWTSAVLETGADVQIGGGVRVGDALQAIVGPRPIDTWVTENCVKISQGMRLSRLVRFNKRNRRSDRSGGRVQASG